MKDLVEYIARALVDKPEAVELTVRPVDGSTMYELRVAPEDVGKVIGRDGRTVNALRTVLTYACMKKGEKARLEVIDEKRGSAPRSSGPRGSAPPASSPRPAESRPSHPRVVEPS